MDDPIIYFPVKEFDLLKVKLHDRATAYFEDISNKSNVDLAANKKHVQDYEEQLKVESRHQKLVDKAKSLKTMVIVFMVISFVLAFLSFIVALMGIATIILLAVGLILCLVFNLIGAGLIVLLIVKLNKDVKNADAILSAEKAKSESLKKVCYEDMEPLISLFDYNIPMHLMDDVIDIIHMDENVNNVRVSDLVHNYDFVLESDKSWTTLNALSGEMLNNPFIFVESYSRRMINKTYTGSRVVMVRVLRTDSKGRTYYATESQTLTATVEHPAPSYRSAKQLFYASEAAPNLSFSRSPSKASSMSDSEREKYVRNQIKSIQKKSDKDIRKGNSGFTLTGNDHFDVFFAANNRDNEVEFRVLYNPLAVQNTMSLITNPVPFGDDFSFRKNKKINIIESAHSRNFNYFRNPRAYGHYSFDRCKELFIKYIDDYFKNLYFDFAPLLCVPQYQIFKGHPLDKSKYSHNYSLIEEEVMVNKLNVEEFRPTGSSKNESIILSFLSASKVGNIDIVKVNASSFQTFPEVDHVTRVARDGGIHIVPVPWIRYEEVNEEKEYALYHADITLQEFNALKDLLPKEYINLNNIHFERGLFAFTFLREPDQILNEKLNSLFKK